MAILDVNLCLPNFAAKIIVDPVLLPKRFDYLFAGSINHKVFSDLKSCFGFKNKFRVNSTDPYQARPFGGTDMEPNRAIVHQKLSADVTHADTDEGLVPFLRDIKQTVRIQIRCRNMRHLIRVPTVLVYSDLI